MRRLNHLAITRCEFTNNVLMCLMYIYIHLLSIFHAFQKEKRDKSVKLKLLVLLIEYYILNFQLSYYLHFMQFIGNLKKKT